MTSLYAFVVKQGVAKPADVGFLYSNLGLRTAWPALVATVDANGNADITRV
jgi:hypothetical protein